VGEVNDADGQFHPWVTPKNHAEPEHLRMFGEKKRGEEGKDSRKRQTAPSNRGGKNQPKKIRKARKPNLGQHSGKVSIKTRAKLKQVEEKVKGALR